MMNWKISGTNSEPKGVRNVVDCLNNSIGINILVGSSNNSISSFDFLLDSISIGISK